MAYVQVNTASQALRIAAFIVAFFSPFFSHAVNIPDDFDFTSLSGVPPENISASIIQCNLGNNVVLDKVQVDGVNLTNDQMITACQGKHISYLENHPSFRQCSSSVSVEVLSIGVYLVHYKYVDFRGNCNVDAQSTLSGGGSLDSSTNVKVCPPSDSPSYNYSFDGNGDGETDVCYKLTDIIEALEGIEEDKEKDEYCENHVLDSGNNTANNMCYSSSNGTSCNVQKVTTDGGGSYYKGVSSSDGGCVNSEHPPYDDAGTGDEKDDCLYSEGINYCKANRDKHCSTTVGVEICDDGCIDDGTNLFCDTNRHPDVGEGDSNYFDDNGTCSVISASSSRGFCEDNDGVWDETSDYQETSCPAGAGTCSVAVAGLCASCFDAGGTWTPDPTALLSDEAKVGIENQALAKTGNDKLTQIEHGQRKTAEATQSTIKSGNAKVVAAIESLGEKLAKTSEEEKESFTTTTSTIDKSKISSLFDATATATLSAEIETLKTDITTSINSIRAEASSMMSITVPSATGYEARNLTLTQGTFDMSLGRFSDFFKALAMPVMLICSILAGFILLGGKN